MSTLGAASGSRAWGNLPSRKSARTTCRPLSHQVDALLHEALGKPAAPVQARAGALVVAEAGDAHARERPATGAGAAIVYAPTRRLADEQGVRLAAAGWSMRW